MEDALARYPDIFHQNLKNQFTKLIVGPVLSIREPIPSMIAIIDGLDEYTGDVPLVELIQTLVHDLPDRFPFRFFFTSRPEPRIIEMFSTSTIDGTTRRLSLQDYPSDLEVQNFLRSELSNIQKKRKLPASWPSMADLKKLAYQSDGLYIYASTLIRFVDSEHGSPQKRLQDALTAHRGVDSLYDQVLREAREYDSYELAMGATTFLVHPLSINELGEFLQLDVRLALRGCSSILTIPDSDNDYARPYHASLKDFLTDPYRSNGHFLDTVQHHSLIVKSCVRYIPSAFENNSQNWEALHYACQYWCHHFHSSLSHDNGVHYIQPDIGELVEGLMKKLRLQWLKNWILRLDSSPCVERIRQDLSSALISITVSRQDVNTIKLSWYLLSKGTIESSDTAHV